MKIRTRLKDLSWSKYETLYGSAEIVARQLISSQAMTSVSRFTSVPIG